MKDPMLHIANYLNIPENCLQKNDENQVIAIVAEDWIKDVKNETLKSFKINEAEINEINLSKKLPEGYVRVVINVYDIIQPKERLLGQKVDKTQNETFCDLQFFVNNENFTKQRKIAYRNYPNSYLIPDDNIYFSTKNSASKLLLNQSVKNLNKVTHVNLLEPVAQITKSSWRFEIKSIITHSVSDALMYSPCMLDNRKKSFILFQLLQVFDYFHENYPMHDLSNLNWSEVSLDEKTWVKVNLKKEIQSKTENLEPEICIENNGCQKDKNDFESLSVVMDKWICGKMTSFEYLMHLNKLAGRRMKDPHHHPILPWVSDLSLPNGVWRDFTKSKYRLNKGDDQLRLQYEMSLNEHTPVKFGETVQVPHHVPDMLSDITYYVYMARIIPKEILQKHVRSYWEPNEYPATIQRIQEWSPDECIPEFFTDPSVFYSKHEDMEDLGIPEWCDSPEEFVKHHRNLLESSSVSEKLHEWIDITFGYKLKGKHAVESLNVYRQLTDRHTNSLNYGIVQLFSKPHPQRRKGCDNSGDNKKENVLDNENSDDNFMENIENNFAPLEGSEDPVVIENKSNKIILPENFKPLEALDQLEKLLKFKGTDLYNIQFSEVLTESLQSDVKHFITYKREDKVSDRNIILILCLTIELYLSPKMQSLDINAPLHVRFQDCISCFKLHKSLLPTDIRNLVKFVTDSFAVSFEQVADFLKHDNNEKEDFPNGIFKEILKQGFPSISPSILLAESANILQFPVYFKLLYRFFAFVVISTNQYTQPLDVTLVPEFNEKLVELFQVLHEYTDGKNLFLSHFISLLDGNLENSIPLLVSVFDQVSLQLSHKQLNEQLLPVIIKIYTNINAQLKLGNPVLPLVEILYDKSFLLQLNVRFGLEAFLSVFPKIMTDCLVLVDSDIIVNSIQWLILRSGPTLTSKFIIRDLLRVVNICFHEQTVNEVESRHKKVIDCLVFSASVYGSCFFTLQYIPHIAFTVCTAISGTRFTNRSYAAMEASVVVLDHLVPYLTDKTLMEQLSRLSKEIIMPLIGLLSSTRIKFPNGSEQRKSLCLKTINLIVNIAIRIGRDMSKKYLTRLLQSLFSNFNQSRNANSAASNQEKFEEEFYFVEPIDPFTDSIATAVQLGGLTQSWLNDSPSSSLNTSSDYLNQNPVSNEQTKSQNDVEQQKELSIIKCEIDETFCSEMVYHAYVPLTRLMGEIHMKTIYFDDNETIMRMSSTFEKDERNRKSNENYKSGDSPNITMVGNRIVVCDNTMEENEATNQMQKKDFNENVNGHLKGNWLAYWEHEIGLPDVDNHIHFNQIELQSFTGHNSAIRCLHVNKSEEWFLTGSKDKTIKIWSLQNTTSEPIQPSYSYQNHKKTPFYVNICEPINKVVSCDGVMQLWDPYTGKLIYGYDNFEAKTSVLAVSLLPRPSQQGLVATTDATLKMIDFRSRCYAQEYRTCPGNSAGAIKSICSSGNWAAVGFTYGVISLVDIRMGSMLRMWQAHDSDIITSHYVSQTSFLTSSLDQTIALWDTAAVSPRMVYRSISEQVHTLETFHDEIISASQANRINVHPLINNLKEGTSRSSMDKAIMVTKLKSDTLRGTLNTFRILPMKRQILVASESGDLRLLA